MTTVYDSSYYQRQIQGSLQSARVVAPILMDLFSPRSVVEVGCGHGTWLGAFHEQKVSDMLGIDGDYIDVNEMVIPLDCFKSFDLTAPLDLGRTFDLALSLEVAEHIPPTSAEVFVASICKLAPVVLFSAAIPSQSGTGHINLQWPHYWHELFARHGYHAFDPIRHKIWHDSRVEWWYRQNIYVYVHGAALQQGKFSRIMPFALEADPFTLIKTSLVNDNMNSAAVRAIDDLGLRATLKRSFALIRNMLRARIKRFLSAR